MIPSPMFEAMIRRRSYGLNSGDEGLKCLLELRNSKIQQKKQSAIHLCRADNWVNPLSSEASMTAYQTAASIPFYPG